MRTNVSERTVGQARKYVDRNIRKGCHCPVCGKYVKEYKRPINSSVTRLLIILYKYQKANRGVKFAHLSDLTDSVIKEDHKFPPVFGGGDFAKLRHWGLIRMREAPNGGTRAGYYQITRLGKQFVIGKAKIPVYMYIYNNKINGVSEEEIDVHEALTVKFNYQELMS